MNKDRMKEDFLVDRRDLHVFFIIEMINVIPEFRFHKPLIYQLSQPKCSQIDSS